MSVLGEALRRAVEQIEQGGPKAAKLVALDLHGVARLADTWCTTARAHGAPTAEIDHAEVVSSAAGRLADAIDREAWFAMTRIIAEIRGECLPTLEVRR